ncbi:hypothetical protein [Stakelama saccharophila]|uniref:Uncharacterized protein n=1 Tax=Stakelama saccharophila TaxID=3075605 RepID=A0ABZ0BBI1_9SPHN|nr:hypothetical protein [Stakelama sp. W311]WNO54633.1 hypothetical protein RPR59_05110 [Stakelama sp. W311]
MPKKKSRAKRATLATRTRSAATRTRTALIGLGVFTVGAGAAGALALWRRARRPSEGHAAPDLAADAHPDGSERAPDAFRPDPDGPVAKADRESLRPATVPAPGLDNRAEELNGTAPGNA